MYKKSNYNIYIGNVDNAQIYYNSFSGSVSSFDSYSLNFLNNIENYAEDTAKNEDRDLKNLLYENGFIVEREFDELNWIIIHNKGIRFDFHSSKIRLTIAPTMLCNYKCYYCYESQATKSKKMSDLVINQLITYVASQMNEELKELYISWYGGEPLLALDIIEVISKKLMDLCKKRSIIYKADILTNGYLLDYQTAKLLCEKYNITNVQIPMDGMAKIYAKRKGVKEDTFNTVIKNICEISDIMKVHVRMNIDKDNKEDILELTKLLFVNYGLKEKIRVYLAAVKNYSNVCNFIDTSCFSNNEFFDFKIEYSDLLKSLDVKTSLLTSIRKPSYMSCGLSRIRNLIIDPDGNFYRCAHLIGHNNQTVGNVFIGQMFNDANMQFLNMEIEEKCKNCNLLPICMGGCYFEKMLNHNDSVCRERVARLQHDIMLSYDYL